MVALLTGASQHGRRVEFHGYECPDDYEELERITP